jgi:hypothetical protein
VKLAEELGRLREAMLKNAREPENYIDVGTVASAETEAKKGNGAKALEFLSKAGKWVLDTAKEVGVNIAAEAIMKASGMK